MLELYGDTSDLILLFTSPQGDRPSASSWHEEGIVGSFKGLLSVGYTVLFVDTPCDPGEIPGPDNVVCEAPCEFELLTVAPPIPAALSGVLSLGGVGGKLKRLVLLDDDGCMLDELWIDELPGLV